jgi:hypothetical protein
MSVRLDSMRSNSSEMRRTDPVSGISRDRAILELRCLNTLLRIYTSAGRQAPRQTASNVLDLMSTNSDSAAAVLLHTTSPHPIAWLAAYSFLL